MRRLRFDDFPTPSSYNSLTVLSTAGEMSHLKDRTIGEKIINSRPSSSSVQRFIFCFLAAACLFIQGCATGPYEPEAKSKNDLLLRQQLDSAIKVRIDEATKAPRLWYAGFAMHSQSFAFKQDIQRMGELTLALKPNAGLLQLSNPAKGQDKNWP
jgi:hypothetical protein